MDLQLAGRRALVTASTAGIGESIARWLAQEGCAVLIHGRDSRRAEQVANALCADGHTVEIALGDLTDDKSAAQVTECALTFGIDILINNAGPFIEHDWDKAQPVGWIDAFNGNVISAVRMARALIPPMRDHKWGRVINLGSRAATTPLPNMVEYSAAKAALVNLTTNLAQHLTGTGVTANTISPGVIITEGMREMFEQRASESDWNGTWPQLEARVAAEYAPNPTGRLGTGEDIAAAVAYLASPLADYVNGIDLRVDGGISPVP